MQKTVYYSKKYISREIEKTQQMGAVAAPVVPAKRAAKVGPLIMGLCLLVGIIAVLVVPMLTAGATQPASSQLAVAASAQQEPAAAPVVENFSTPKEAMNAIGIAPSYPKAMPEESQLAAACAVDGQMLETTYTYGKYNIIFRSAAGSEDLSGEDIEAYAYSTTEEVNGAVRAYYGVSDKKLSAATWADGTYSYAVIVPGGIEPETMRQIAESVG